MQRVKGVKSLSDRADARHDEVAQAVRRVIIRKGLADTTLRDVAREGGFTTGVLMHHFPDKRAVIFGAFTAAWADWIRESREMFAVADTPHDLLLALVNHAIPDSQERREEWRLWVEMWAYAGTDGEFAEQLLHADAMVWQSDLNDVIRRLVEAGLFRSDIQSETEATIMNRLMDGLGLRAWLTGEWDEARRHLILHLESLGLPPDVAADLFERRPERRN